MRKKFYHVYYNLNKFSTVMTPTGPAFHGSCHEDVPSLKGVSSNLWLTDGLTLLARIEIVATL